MLCRPWISSKGKRSEEAVLHHGERPLAPFLGRLEHKTYGSVEATFGGEKFGGTEQHGRVAVVAAGMHRAGRRGAVRSAPVR